MSTTAYRSNHSSTTSFSRRQNRTPTSSSPMTNDRARLNARTNNNFTVPVPPPRELLINSSTAVSSSPSNSSSTASLPTARLRPITTADSNEDSTKASKQLYMFSNPPRILQRQPTNGSKYLRDGRMRHRVSSAPDENCLQTPPRSPLTQQQPPKPSSANETLTPRSRDDSLGAHSRQPSIEPLRSVGRLVKRDDQQQKNSLAALMQEQQRSKVPEAVQKRRILLLLRRVPPMNSSPPVPSPRRQNYLSTGATPITVGTHTTSALKPSTHSPDFNRIQQGTMSRDERQQSILQQCIAIPTTSPSPHVQQTDSTSPAPSNFLEPEFADSAQLAAILASIQQQDDWNSGDNEQTTFAQANVDTTRKTSNVPSTYDPTKYEYIVANSLDTTTFKLSPRTLRPDEQRAARSRLSQYYRQEMRSSTNSQPPPLLASIVTDNSHSGSGNDKTFTLRLNTTATLKKQSSLEDVDPFGTTVENNINSEQVPLCFDEILKCFYDPTTGHYYELYPT